MERENKYYKEYDRGVYSQSNNYYNNFFDMVNHYKDNKDELLKGYHKTLQEIYFDSDFRHLYSEIYEKLSYLDLLTREDDISSMIYINENINLIYKKNYIQTNLNFHFILSIIYIIYKFNKIIIEKKE